GYCLVSANPFICRVEQKSSACCSRRKSVVCPLDSSILVLEPDWSLKAFWSLGSWFVLDGAILFSCWVLQLSSGLHLGFGFSLPACKRRTPTWHLLVARRTP